MRETKMGYRGSKSGLLILFIFLYNLFLVNPVKEQRVDGSWCINSYSFPITNYKNISHLRCTLTGFKRNYQVNILSNQLNKKKFFQL